MSDPHDLSVNPVLAKLKPTADDDRQFLVLTGYVGETTDGTVRLYENLDLRTYFEIPIKDIVWAEKLIPGLQASTTLLVIDAATQGTRVTSAARHVEAGYLRGLIASRYLRGAARGDSAVQGREGSADGATACDTAPFCAFPHGASNCHASGVCISDPVAYPTA
jgi:hypothetical protein